MNDLIASYDEFADVLYLSLGSPVKAIAHTDIDNLLWRESVFDHSTVGVTILDYAEDWRERRDNLAYRLAPRLHLSEQQVLEHLPVIR
ncbi:hypothetical protein IGS75_01325 [Gluconobacter sphaericus]|uniref:hypothetical protein n=1 Tax=Gluconobacter sphaericus TaxID=574987 RepID=UPI001921FB50|nr:hypothetical protein [Gluconobacter sphaericus]QQX91311.1 hypothetical protein IGS75_01325 [Gluconobacter sphaericus]